MSTKPVTFIPSISQSISLSIYYLSIYLSINLSNIFINQVKWLLDKQLITDENIQKLSTNITLHLLHILDQYAKGFIAGVNSNRCKNHVLGDKKYCF